MYLIQIKHAQIKIPLCSFWTVQDPGSKHLYIGWRIFPVDISRILTGQFINSCVKCQSVDLIGYIWSQISKVYLGYMSRDVHICSHWLRPRNPPPPAFGLLYSRGAIGLLRQTTSPCNTLVDLHVTRRLQCAGLDSSSYSLFQRRFTSLYSTKKASQKIMIPYVTLASAMTRNKYIKFMFFSKGLVAVCHSFCISFSFIQQIH